MNQQTRIWVEDVKSKNPDFFGNSRVLEVGSANINGSTRDLFVGGEYIGIDVAPYSCVDVVVICHEYKEPDESFDVVYSTNSLEHDMYWKKSLRKMYKLTRPGGLMFFMVASTWPEHGCSRHMPEHSLTSLKGKPWLDYYKNLEAKDIVSVLDFNELFTDWEMGLYYNMAIGFWGRKK